MTASAVGHLRQVSFYDGDRETADLPFGTCVKG